MNQEISFEEFKQMISEYMGVDINKLHKEASFIEDLGVDSLSLVNFIVKVEKEYNFRIDSESGFILKNVGEAYDVLVHSLRESQKNN